MNLRALILAIIFVGIFTSIDQAKAQSVEFDFTFDTGLGTYFSGILFTSPIANQNGSFDVTNITGNRVDVVPNLGPQYTPILGLESTFFAPDNLLYYPATVLQVGPDVYTDGTGIGFSTSSFDYILFGGPQYSGANTHIEQRNVLAIGRDIL